MNEELLKILEKAYEAALKTGEFIIQEGAVLIQQFLLWKTIEHSLLVVLGLVLIVGIPLIIRGLFKRIDDGYGYKFLGKKPTSMLMMVNMLLVQ
jgi:hypothetical protein